MIGRGAVAARSVGEEAVTMSPLAVNPHHAGVEQMIASEGANERRLAAEQRANTPLSDAEAHVIERERVAKALRRLVERDGFEPEISLVARFN
jgi:hypothetical protein